MKNYFILFIFLFGCQDSQVTSKTKLKSLLIYQVKYDEQWEETIRVIGLNGRKLFYIPKDSSLRIYNEIPGNAKLLFKPQLIELIHTLDVEQLLKMQKIDWYRECECKDIKYTQYILTTNDFGDIHTIVLSEYLGCIDKFPCNFIDLIHKLFEELKIND